MRSEVTTRIERHLDARLGVWTRLLPWRREIVCHLEDAYDQMNGAKRGQHKIFDEHKWRTILSDFGDVANVAEQMRKEHWPQHVALRGGAVTLSALIVVYIFGLAGDLLFNAPALAFVLGPALAVFALDARRGSTSWTRANAAGVLGALCGALFGAAMTIVSSTDPSKMGIGLAVSALSALYGVVFFAPRESSAIALVAVVLVDVGFLFASFDTRVTLQALRDAPWHNEYGRFAAQSAAICVAGIMAGMARFGLRGTGRNALSIGAGTFLVCYVLLLIRISSPESLGLQSAIAFATLPFTATASIAIAASAGFARRLFVH